MKPIVHNTLPSVYDRYGTGDNTVIVQDNFRSKIMLSCYPDQYFKENLCTTISTVAIFHVTKKVPTV